MAVLEGDFHCAINKVVHNLCGIEHLYEDQITILRHLVNQNNVFYTSPTNSGKTLPPVILPEILKELNKLSYSFPEDPKVLFVTALNSIQSSLVSNLTDMGIQCGVITRSNAEQLLSSHVSVLFVGPEVMRNSTVIQTLMLHRTSFVCKIVDEAHLGTID